MLPSPEEPLPHLSLAAPLDPFGLESLWDLGMNKQLLARAEGNSL